MQLALHAARRGRGASRLVPAMFVCSVKSDVLRPDCVRDARVYGNALKIAKKKENVFRCDYGYA